MMGMPQNECAMALFSVALLAATVGGAGGRQSAGGGLRRSADAASSRFSGTGILSMMCIPGLRRSDGRWSMMGMPPALARGRIGGAVVPRDGEGRGRGGQERRDESGRELHDAIPGFRGI